MKKHLMLVLALAFVVGIAFAAYAEVQNVKVSGDLNMYGIARNNFGLDSKAGLKDERAFASIVRVRVDADLTDNVSTTVRLLNDRYWGNQDDDATTNNSKIDIDLAYATLKEFLYSPLTLTIGRQELRFGNAMIIGTSFPESAPTSSAFGGAGRDWDLSTRKSFDAVRATLNYDPLVIDVVLAKVSEKVLNNNDDINLYGINANYMLDKKTTIEGYVWAKETRKKNYQVASGHSKSDKVIVPGVRIAGAPLDALTYSVEAAYQLGKYNTGALSKTDVQSRGAFGGEVMVSYNLKNVKYSPTVTGIYCFFQGNKGNKNYYRGWDPMFEDQKTGDIANALIPQSNAHVLGGNVVFKPKDDLTVKGEYFAYWWDKKYGDKQVLQTLRGDTITMNHKKYVGSEIDATLTYDYTEDVQFNLLGGIFMPGGAFDKQDCTDHGNRSVATELVGSMKVTF